MPFTIPNEADAFNANQAEPDKVDIDILTAGYADSGVIVGCAVTAQVSPDMTVAVAAGAVTVGTAHAAVTAGNVTIGTADATNPRIDLITVNSSGTKACTAGTAAAEPVLPAIPADSVVLAAVYVPANDTTIASNQIVDKRVMVNRNLSVNTQSGTTYTLGPRDIQGLIRSTHASGGLIITAPQDSDADIPVGSWGFYEKFGTGAARLDAGTGATVNGGGLLGTSTVAYGAFGMWVKIAANTYTAMSLDGYPAIFSHIVANEHTFLTGFSTANNQTGTSYTVVLTDAGKMIEMNNAGAIDLKIPTHASVAFGVGTVISAYQQGAGQITVSAVTPGTTTVRIPNGAKTAKQYSVLSAWKRANDEWIVYGDTVP